MITIFNRRELTVTFSMEEQTKIRNLLDSHNVNYYIKVINMFAQGSSRGHIGSPGLNMNAAYEYKFYVHKDHFEIAQAILAGRYR